MECLCCDFGRWNCGVMGRFRLWWWQLQSPAPAQGRSEAVWHIYFFCCHFGRWNHSDMGQSKLWWWQLQCSRSVHIHLVARQARKCPSSWFDLPRMKLLLLFLQILMLVACFATAGNALYSLVRSISSRRMVCNLGTRNLENIVYPHISTLYIGTTLIIYHG